MIEIIDFEQFFFIIRSSGNNIKKYLSLINFFVFKTASPVPNGLFLKYKFNHFFVF